MSVKIGNQKKWKKLLKNLFTRGSASGGVAVLV
jgi:hypothetical protein